jgi:MFS family permease
MFSPVVKYWFFLKARDSLVINANSGVLQVMFLATIPSVLYIDKLGRKPILTIGAIGMATCHIIIAVIVAKNRDSWPTHKAAGWAAVAMVWLFVIHFGYSWGPCAWIIVAEIWPLSNRPYGIALGASSNWMNNFIVGQVCSPSAHFSEFFPTLPSHTNKICRSPQI